MYSTVELHKVRLQKIVQTRYICLKNLLRNYLICSNWDRLEPLPQLWEKWLKMDGRIDKLGVSFTPLPFLMINFIASM